MTKSVVENGVAGEGRDEGNGQLLYLLWLHPHGGRQAWSLGIWRNASGRGPGQGTLRGRDWHCRDRRGALHDLAGVNGSNPRERAAEG